MIPETNATSENKTNLKPGQVKFYDNYLPKLAASNYEVSVTQTIKGDGLAQQQFVRHQEFEVSGPRFVLPEGDIHSVYPPANAVENFRGTLPQIIFRKRTLPWERTVDSTAENSAKGIESPWMALVLFEENELLLDAEHRDKATQTRAISRNVAEGMLNPPAHYLPPIELKDGVWQNMRPSLSDEENCYTIDISIQDFKDIVPKTADLPYLAHVREVNTDDKEFLGMHADGWFSVLLANRLPKTPPEVLAEDSIEKLSGVKSVRNIVHLVSLEGFLPYLEDFPHGNINNTNYQKVRLASLASWEFYCSPPEESFTKLMESLDVGMLKVPNTQNVQNAYLKTALEGGYFPMQYNTRNGEKTMAWYRGPLMPVLNDYSPEIQDEDVFFSVEAGMIYDNQKGVFDISYAVAWQIGRLLALQDSHFSQSLLDWKKIVNRKIDEFLKRQTLLQRSEVNTSSVTGGDDTFGQLEVENIQRLMSPDFATDIFGDNFLQRLNIISQVYHQFNDHKNWLEVELENFPGFVPKDQYLQRLENGEDPQQGLMKEIFG